MSIGLLIRKLQERLSVEFLAGAAIALGVLLRLLNLGSRELWYDEVLSVLLSTGQISGYDGPKDLPVVLAEYTPLLSLPPESSPRDILKTVTNLLRGLAGGEPHPPLFFLTQHLWLRLFGNSEVAVRSLGALLSVGAIASAYGLGRTVLGHRGGLFLAALFATNPYYMFHSLNMRMYGPLVLWTTLSAWALLQVMGEGAGELWSGDAEGRGRGGELWRIPLQTSSNTQHRSLFTLLWNLLLIGSVAAGLMTFYLFAYWIVALVAVVIYRYRRRWWQHGLRLGAGVLLTLPWILWGITQQLRNADFKRFNAPPGFLTAMVGHVRDVANTLGTHLLLGDWVTSLPQNSTTVAGFVVVALLVTGAIALSPRDRLSFRLACILGIFPLLLAFGADIISGKFTLGFGWGRSTIFILPGCLLLIASWVERAAGKWRQPAAAVLLVFYLGISISDFSLRQRWMFHQIADIIAVAPLGASTLIAMNSQAWGHVMRLAYYIPTSAPVMLLATKSSQLAPALEKVLSADPKRYDRVLWLDSANPVWSPPSTEAEKKQIQQVLQTRFQLKDIQSLSGTMNLDEFTINVYD